MKTKLFLLVAIIYGGVILVGCSGEEKVAENQVDPAELQKRIDFENNKGGKKAGNGIFEPYDPPPPKDLKNKDVVFGGKLTGK